MVRFSVFFSISLLCSISALADDAPAPAEPAKICESVIDIPLISEISASKASVDAQAAELDASLADMKSKCAEYKAKPDQEGDAINQMRSSLATTSQQSAVFSKTSDALLPKEKVALESLRMLGEKACMGEMQGAYESLRRKKLQFAQQANSACNMKADRAAAVAGLGKTANLDDEKTQNAIIDPKANRADSTALLKQANEYAGKNNLKSPMVSAHDTTCGESCVAMLRLQSTEDQYGADSQEYAAALEAVNNTQPAKYGYQ